MESKTMNNLFKFIFIFAYILIFLIYLCGCNDNRNKISNKNKTSNMISDIPYDIDIVNKVYFAYKEILDLKHTIDLDYNTTEINKIPTKGIIGSAIFKKESIIYGPKLYDNVLIDPFLLGDKQVEILDWRFRPRDDWGPPETMKMKGEPLPYLTNNKDLILAIFAGPDRDIDNVNIDLHKFSWPKNLIQILAFPNNYWVIPKIYHTDIIQYDPTNGINSNGDIIWPIYKDKVTGGWQPGVDFAHPIKVMIEDIGRGYKKIDP